MARQAWREAQERQEAAVERRFREDARRTREWRALQDRTRALAGKAVEALGKVLDDPEADPRVALAVLKLVLDGPQPAAPNLALLLLGADDVLAEELAEEDAARP